MANDIGSGVLATPSLLSTTVAQGGAISPNTTAARDNQADILFNTLANSSFNLADREYFGVVHTYASKRSLEAHKAIVDRVVKRLGAEDITVVDSTTKTDSYGNNPSTHFELSWDQADLSKKTLGAKLRENTDRARDVVAAEITARALDDAFFAADHEETKGTYHWDTPYTVQSVTDDIVARVQKTIAAAGLQVTSSTSKQYDGTFDAQFNLGWTAV